MTELEFEFIERYLSEKWRQEDDKNEFDIAAALENLRDLFEVEP